MTQLSIIITAKNEPYLEKTIEDIKAHAETDIEIIAEEDDGRGQRAMCRKLVDQAKGKYIMKVDAHCSFGQGFDRIMLEDMEDNMVMAPFLLGLDAENWKPIQQPTASSYCFDTNLIFQYNTQQKGLLEETMCMQGSCYLMTKENYLKWNIDDPTLGSWGHQGVEIGIKAWTNGGKCVTNKKTYYAHLFRESEKDFPYKRDKKAIRKTSKLFKDRFLNKDIAELIKKFGYPADWTPEKVMGLN